jgi:hypothetical protein
MKLLFSGTAFLFAILILSTNLQCKKNDDEKVVSKTELLTTGSWKLTAVMADEDANGTYETDEFASFSDCFKDNYLTFPPNGNLESNEGPTKCSPSDPQTETATWTLTQNETHLKVNGDELKLEELTISRLNLKESYSGGRSSLVTFTKR